MDQAWKNRQNILDVLGRLQRGPQIITPKDMAAILSCTGAGPGDRVVDAGTGSGFLAIFLANYVRPGKVVTYENDRRFVELARKNIKKSGLEEFIKLKSRDVTRGVAERNVDLVTLDMKNSHKVVKLAYNALKLGGWIAVYSPTAESLRAAAREIRKSGFCEIKTVESIAREWQTERTTRPKTMGLMHTGFLTFARKPKPEKNKIKKSKE